MDNPLALIIEDESDLSTIFAEATSVAGYDTEIIDRGDAAMERLQVVTPDMIVLDIHLPAVAGSEILRYIRSQERLKHVKVIVATADASMGDLLSGDADLVLLKPISFKQLYTFALRMKAQL